MSQLIRKGAWLPEIIGPELKRKIEACERPFHLDIVLPSDCLPDLEQLGIWLTRWELTHQLRTIGCLKIPPMAIMDKFTSLWALRNFQQYRHLSPLHIRKLYFIFKAEPTPPLTGEFAPAMSAIMQMARKPVRRAQRESRLITQQQQIESLKGQIAELDRKLEEQGHPLTDYGHIDFNNYHTAVKELRMRVKQRERRLKELR